MSVTDCGVREKEREREGGREKDRESGGRENNEQGKVTLGISVIHAHINLKRLHA